MEVVLLGAQISQVYQTTTADGSLRDRVYANLSWVEGVTEQSTKVMIDGKYKAELEPYVGISPLRIQCALNFRMFGNDVSLSAGNFAISVDEGAMKRKLDEIKRISNAQPDKKQPS